MLLPTGDRVGSVARPRQGSPGKRSRRPYLLQCSMAVALGSPAAASRGNARLVGSGRDARGLSRTFSLPDQLAGPCARSFFPPKGIRWQPVISKACRRPATNPSCTPPPLTARVGRQVPKSVMLFPAAIRHQTHASIDQGLAEEQVFGRQLRPSGGGVRSVNCRFKMALAWL